MINGAMIWLCLTDEVLICSHCDCDFVHFGRPSIPKIREEHLIDMNPERECLTPCFHFADGISTETMKKLNYIWEASLDMIGRNHELQVRN